jgi:hypothetical protein
VQPRTIFQSYQGLTRLVYTKLCVVIAFWLGLSKEFALQLDIAAGGSFTHKTTVEEEALLDRILENTPPLEPLRVELKPS